MHFLSPGPNSKTSVDEYAANPRFRGLQTELRSLLITGAQSTVTTRIHTPEAALVAIAPAPGFLPLLLHLSEGQDNISLTK